MDKTQINLCRALKLKNRLASQMSRMDQLLKEHNSSVQGVREYDVRILYTTRILLAEQLVGLKVALAHANATVQGKIFEVAESKALCKTRSMMDTTHGPKSKIQNSIFFFGGKPLHFLLSR